MKKKLLVPIPGPWTVILLIAGVIAWLLIKCIWSLF